MEVFGGTLFDWSEIAKTQAIDYTEAWGSKYANNY
jgi:hypothetical protein